VPGALDIMVLVSKFRGDTSSNQPPSTNSFFNKIRTSLTRNTSSTSLQVFTAPVSPPASPLAPKEKQKAVLKNGKCVAEEFEDSTTGGDSSSGKITPVSDTPDKCSWPVDNMVLLSDFEPKPSMQKNSFQEQICSRSRSSSKASNNVMKAHDAEPDSPLAEAAQPEGPIRTFARSEANRAHVADPDSPLAEEARPEGPTRTFARPEADCASPKIVAKAAPADSPIQGSNLSLLQTLLDDKPISTFTKPALSHKMGLWKKPSADKKPPADKPGLLWKASNPPEHVPPAWNASRQEKEVLGPVAQRTRFPSKLPPLSGLGSAASKLLSRSTPGNTSTPVLEVCNLPASASSPSDM